MAADGSRARLHPVRRPRAEDRAGAPVAAIPAGDVDYGTSRPVSGPHDDFLRAERVYEERAAGEFSSRLIDMPFS